MAGQAAPAPHPGDAWNKLCAAGQVPPSGLARPLDAWRAACSEPGEDDELLFGTDGF